MIVAAIFVSVAFVAYASWLVARAEEIRQEAAEYLIQIGNLVAKLPTEIPPPPEPSGFGWYVPDRVRLVDGFATREAAIADAIREGHTVEVHVGELRAMDIAQWLSADDVREMARDRAYDNLCLEDLDVTCGPDDEAERALTQWARRYLDADCTFYCEGDEVSAEEIERVRASMSVEAAQ